MPKCLMCNKDIPLNVPNVETRKFCGLSCSTTYRNLSRNRSPVNKECLYCGKGYSTPYHCKDTSKFCSNVCRLNDLKKNNSSENCSHCGKPIEVNWKRRKSKRVFCSIECYRTHNPQTEEVCTGCGNTFKVYPSRKGYYSNLYCSKVCYIQYGCLGTDGFVRNEQYESVRGKIQSTAKFLKWRTSILERDGYTCTECGSEKDLRVHHKLKLSHIIYKYNSKLSLDSDKIDSILSSFEFTDVDNGITYCNSCHMIEHHLVPLSGNR